jgi:hypothetical protein
MIVLSEQTDNLQVVLGAAPATNQLQCVVSWRDRSSSSFDAGRTAVETNGTTPVNIAPAPASGKQRLIDFISIFNADTDDRLVTIRLNANGTSFTIWKEVLSPGDTVRFIEGAGFNVFRTYQSIKSFTVHGDASANWTLTNATQAERLAGNSSRSIFMLDLEGYTQVRFRANQQVTSASVNTPVLRAKYYTSYTTTAANFIQLGKTQEVEISLTGTGYRDTGWVELAMAARTSGICIGFTEAGGDGVADPALGATDILFR